MAGSSIGAKRPGPLPTICGVFFLFLMTGCPAEERTVDDEGEGLLEQETFTPVPEDEAAGVRGTELVASGVDPDWRLEIERGGRLMLTPVFGLDEIAMPAPVPVEHEGIGVTTYVAEFEEYTVLVEVHDEECMDPRGPERYEATVRIDVNGRELNGCGTWLLDAPGEPAVDPVDPAFDPANRGPGGPS